MRAWGDADVDGVEALWSADVVVSSYASLTLGDTDQEAWAVVNPMGNLGLLLGVVEVGGGGKRRAGMCDVIWGYFGVVRVGYLCRCWLENLALWKEGKIRFLKRPERALLRASAVYKKYGGRADEL